MRPTSFTRATATVFALALGALPLLIAPAAAKPSDAARRRALKLFAIPIDILQVNNVFCPVSNIGKVCADKDDNPGLEGGFWPRGTPDSYIYNSGLQLGGIIPNSPFTGGTADTIGVYFMDPRGSQFEGEGLTNVYNSANTADQEAWPNGAIARDPALYNPVLIGKKFVSQQDLWVRVWDGNPATTIGGSHPMGIVVDERGMAWNYPTGNEDIIYFIYTVYNVSASDPAKYANPTIDVDMRAEIAALGTQFQALNEQRYGINIPPEGYDITQTFLAFFEDCDVGVGSGENYATANFVFNLSFCYKSDFLEPTWTFPPSIFSAPLYVGPGFTGVKYLRSPLGDNGQELGLTLFSNTGNATSSGGAGYIDSRGGKQLYRYLSGTSSPAQGDNPCTNQGQQLTLRYCFLFQVPVDARFFMSSGPFTLPAGESRTIVVAYVMAAALGTAFDEPTAAGCVIGTDCKASPPPSPLDLATGADTIRTVDKLAGWVNPNLNVSAADTAPANDTITQNEVGTFPRTLFNKSLVAQSVFDNKFLLPFSPEQPDFFLIPGDKKVTVVWRPSASETTGDPYFDVADSAGTALYDPNFRRFDVEGYRVYRGRSQSDMRLVAQFDYAGTVLRDFTGTFAYEGRCAPELGITGSGSDCPANFPVPPALPDPGTYIDHPLAGNIIQIPAGGRLEKADGGIYITSADTAASGGGHDDRSLTDGGVPFAFEDDGLVNSFGYFYAVVAYDVNSLRSGPSSLESPMTTIKSVTPRAEAGQTTAGTSTPPLLLSAGGVTLNPDAAIPKLDSTTGIFAGPMPPSNGIQTGLAVFADQLITGGTVTITIDSVMPGHADEGDGVSPPAPAQYYVSAAGPTGVSHQVIPLQVDGGSADAATVGYVPVTSVDSARGSAFQGSNAFSLYSAVNLSSTGMWRLQSWGRGSANSDPTRSERNGPRWWTGTANENTPDPNKEQCSPNRTVPSEAGPAGTCVLTDSSIALNKNAGSMPGVLILHLSSYLTYRSIPGREIEAVAATVTRAADFRVYWGAAGAIDSVVDVTHGVRTPFKTKLRASWGILNDSSFTNVLPASTTDGNNGLLTLSDIGCVDPLPTFVPVDLNTDVPLCADTARAFLMDHARLAPIAMHSGSFEQTATMTTTGNGFIFYINGHFFLMQMAALPPAGTTWNARFYAGAVRMAAAEPINTYGSFLSSVRPAAVPGLRSQFQFTGAVFDSTVTNDTVLANVHTVPDPYYVTNALEISPNSKVLRFVHLPARCIIRIYSTSAILVQTLTHNDPTGGSEETWNLRNRNEQFVASGVYFFHVEAPDGKTKVGRFTVVNFAP